MEGPPVTGWYLRGREAMGAVSGVVPHDPRLEGIEGRSVSATRWGFVIGHVLFAAYWLVGKPNLIGALLVWAILQIGVFAGNHRYFAHR